MSGAPMASSAPMEVPFGPGGTVLLRKMVLDEDAPLLHDWFSRDYARFWGLQGKTVDEIREKFAGIEASGTCDVIFGVLASTGERLFMFQSYDVTADELGRHYAVQPGDRGFHFMIGPAERPRPAVAYHALQAVCAWIFRDAQVRRIVCEPDVRNEKAMRRLVQAGFSADKVLHLRYKSALLMHRARASFEAARTQPVPSQPDKAPVSGLALKYHLLVSRIGRRIGLIERHW